MPYWRPQKSTRRRVKKGKMSKIEMEEEKKEVEDKMLTLLYALTCLQSMS
jgi:hypothetical protein